MNTASPWTYNNDGPYPALILLPSNLHSAPADVRPPGSLPYRRSTRTTNPSPYSPSNDDEVYLDDGERFADYEKGPD
jgi:hypothetical protein